MKYRKVVKIDFSVAINKVIKKIKGIDGVENIRLENDLLVIEASKNISDEEINNAVYNHEEKYKTDTFYFDYIDCPNCASKVAFALNKSKKIKEAQVIFLSNKIIVKHQEEDIYQEVVSIVKSIEKDTNVFIKENNENNKEKENTNVKVRVFSKKHAFICGIILFVLATIYFLLGNAEILKLIRIEPLINGELYVIPVFILYLLSYSFLSYDLIYKSIYGIIHKDYFNESLLMVIASLGAIVLSFFGEIELLEACAVVLLYKIGESLQDKATQKSKNEIRGLISLDIDKVTLISGEIVDIEKVKVGEIISIKAGEKIPLDGIIKKGNTTLDMKVLTGESEPIFVKEGDNVLSGSINLSNVVEVEVSKENAESTISKVKRIVEDASEKKAVMENFITKFARIYTPIVLVIAIISLIVQLILKVQTQEALNNVFAFLVISCPCSLVISIPLAYFASIGRASKKGILVKGGNYIEALTRVEKVVFDKTGTLTEGKFEVVSINPFNIEKQELVNILCKVERHSNHPIAKFIVQEFNLKIESSDAIIEEIPGLGLKYEENNITYLVGNDKLLEKFDIEYQKNNQVGSHIYVAKANNYVGNIVIRDKIKENSKEVISYLKDNKIESIMLTGDKKIVGELIAEEIGINEVKCELLPQDKYQIVDKMVIEKNKNIVYVGDGINDTPSLRRADIGITLGGIGSDLAKEVSDIVIMNDDISKVVEIIKLSKFTKKIIFENLIFILFTKLLAMVISLTGILDSYAMLIAIFADVGVCLLCILNSLRLLKSKY